MLLFILAAIQNSIIPVMERAEQIDLLPKEKFAPKQWETITEALQHKEETFRVMSYNVLFAFLDKHYPPEYQWAARLPRIVEMIEEVNPDIIGFQEVEGEQLPQLVSKLHKTYGNYETLFFNKNRFSLLQGKSWKISDKKELIMALVQDLRTKKTAALFNVHLSYSDIKKREAEVLFLVEHLQALSTGHPILLLGDFNTFPAFVDHQFPFFDGNWIAKEIETIPLQDALRSAIIGHVGPTGSFTNTAGAEKVEPFTGTGTPGVYLDHIFVSREISILLHAVNPATVNGYFPSDHMPLLVDCYTISQKKFGKTP